MILKTVNDPSLMWAWYGISDLFLTTSNATVSISTGRLIMGKGHALQAKQRWGKNVDKNLAKAIEEAVSHRCLNGEWKDLYYVWKGNKFRIYGDYCLLVSRNWPDVSIGLFQTKRYFGDGADTKRGSYTIENMIHWSTLALEKWCANHPQSRVDMPFPGIGAGGLNVDQVMPIIQRLPDTVYVWRLD